MCLPGSFEVSDDVAVGIKDADRRDILDRQMPLTTGFAQQGLRIEDRWLAMVLMIKNGSTFSHVTPGTIARTRHYEGFLAVTFHELDSIIRPFER